ncbi:MAG TPA: nuclear transport factor 2 family protein [Terriglobales bacterium]|nr:nuclear transport factor 2 family protein [Terriglobales bacterium]
MEDACPGRADGRLDIIDRMTPELAAKEFALAWIAEWNSHNLDAIMSHYDEDVVLTSPVAATILNHPSGIVEGKLALRDYFRRGLEAYPNLNFELLDVMHGISSIVVCYRNQKGTKTAEFMEMSDKGKIMRVIANYSA